MQRISNLYVTSWYPSPCAKDMGQCRLRQAPCSRPMSLTARPGSVRCLAAAEGRGTSWRRCRYGRRYSVKGRLANHSFDRQTGADRSNRWIREVWCHGVQIMGPVVDSMTRCRHYASAQDIVAIRFACCGRWYACHACHQAHADHEAARWPASRFDEKAILCGRCGYLLGIHEYLRGAARCPSCAAAFNPGCRQHRDLYFETGVDDTLA